MQQIHRIIDLKGFFCLFILFLGVTLSPVSKAATFTVTNTGDSSDPGSGSLRAAIDNANGAGGADTIVFDSSVTGTIELSGPLPIIIEALTITGPGSTTLTIDANGAGKVFDFNSATNDQSFTIEGLTITGGNSTSLGGGISISTGDSLTINSCKIVSNISSAGGGGISHVGNLLVINDSTISQNSATGGFHGGGIYSTSGTLLSLLDSTVTQNEADSFGGGIFINSTTEVLVMRSVLKENNASSGGGFAFSAFATSPTFSFINSTFSDNTADENGGGLYLLGFSITVNFSSVTIANNTADDNADGAGDGGGFFSAGSVTINTKNTLIGNNTDKSLEANDCSATLTSLGYNLIEDLTGCTVDGDATGNLTGTAPLLNALADNGGSTQTHALQPLSPAVDAGNPTGCTDHATPTPGPLTMDQRGSGFVRDIDGDLEEGPRCDIGAFELTVCGDGVLSIGEECDDGNLSNTDTCLNTCVAAICGDSFVQDSVEACDDGNLSNTDACLNTCVAAICGDNFVRASVEQCDNGAANSSTAPDACRTSCLNPVCGDSVVDTGETCDDANVTNGDGCSSSCATETPPDSGDDDSADAPSDPTTPPTEPTTPPEGEEPSLPPSDDEDDEISDETESPSTEEEEVEDMPGSSSTSGGGCRLNGGSPQTNPLPFFLSSFLFIALLLFFRNKGFKH